MIPLRIVSPWIAFGHGWATVAPAIFGVESVKDTIAGAYDLGCN
jgi:hypothetical protein